jgi:hypothetical protein
MAQRLSLWIFVAVCASGCLPRERFNKNCEWTSDSIRALDTQNPRDYRHLVEDAQLAEELRVRYADFKHKEPFGYEGHGGLLEQGKVGDDCQAKLDTMIQKSHHVTAQQIEHARKHRDPRFDLAVLLSFSTLYAFCAFWMCRPLVSRFAHERVAMMIAAAFGAIATSAAGVQLMVLWATMAEMLRVGNDHLGPRRGALIPWIHQLGPLFIAGMLIFCLAVAFWYRRSPVK